MRAVEMMPVERPAFSASSKIDSASAPFWLAQFSSVTFWVTPMVPFSDLTPVVIAVAVGAESATCESCV